MWKSKRRESQINGKMLDQQVDARNSRLATSGAGVVVALSATLDDIAAAEGPPMVLGTNVGGLGAKIPVGGFVPPKPGFFDPVMDLDTLATTAGASDDLPAGQRPS
ncbi:hypothetical protein SUGI_0963600 [Cryptomeria japonica]|nr:hypothetical protein SUGI_0963600 [Cryptomeria japonica]